MKKGSEIVQSSVQPAPRFPSEAVTGRMCFMECAFIKGHIAQRVLHGLGSFSESYKSCKYFNFRSLHKDISGVKFSECRS